MVFSLQREIADMLASRRLLALQGCGFLDCRLSRRPGAIRGQIGDAQDSIFDLSRLEMDCLTGRVASELVLQDWPGRAWLLR